MPDFTNCKRLLGNAYAGANGKKIGIEYQGEQYMLKFPPSGTNKRTELSYTNSCLSEHIASSIFNMVGITAQKTILGTYDVDGKTKIVCACKDFTADGSRLYDFCSIKNTIIDSGHNGTGTELDDVLETIEKQQFVNPEELLEHFWNVFVMDAFLGNFDRHNGNWGFLYSYASQTASIAPVYDCGSCLLPQADEKVMRAVLENESELHARIFRQDLLQIYQKQSDLRDELRQESRDRITEIVDAINHGSHDNPQMQEMLIQLADRLAKTKGKKQYGYLNAGTKKLVDAIVAELAGDSRIRELYSLWYEQKEDVLRTYTNKIPERIPLEQEKEFKTIRNAVVQAAMQLHIPQEEQPLSDPVPPRVDFVDDGSDMYPKVIWSLREPEVEPDPEAKQFLHEAAICGSVDAVYGVGKQYLKTDIQKAISMFELAAEQGNSYAEYQLGKIYCFGQGVPQNLGVGMEWLKASASHGNEYAAQLLEKVEERLHQQTVSVVFGLLRGLAGMIQTSANQHIRRRNSIDRKQRQKIEEKKQAHGQRSSGYEYDYSEGQTM